MKKIPKQEYTVEFKTLAVNRVTDGLTVGAAARELGLIDQTLRHRVKALYRRRVDHLLYKQFQVRNFLIKRCWTLQ